MPDSKNRGVVSVSSASRSVRRPALALPPADTRSHSESSTSEALATRDSGYPSPTRGPARQREPVQPVRGGDSDPKKHRRKPERVSYKELPAADGHSRDTSRDRTPHQAQWQPPHGSASPGRGAGSSSDNGSNQQTAVGKRREIDTAAILAAAQIWYDAKRYADEQSSGAVAAWSFPIGGMLAGAAALGALGALVGTIVPGIGAVVGAFIGLCVGFALENGAELTRVSRFSGRDQKELSVARSQARLARELGIRDS